MGKLLIALAALWAVLIAIAIYGALTRNTGLLFAAIIAGMPASFGVSMIARRYQ